VGTPLTKYGDPLTPRQWEIFRLIVEYTGEHGTPPTLRDLCRGMGIRSPNGVMNHILSMRKKGVIFYRPREPGKPTTARRIVVPELSAALKRAAESLLKTFPKTADRSVS
jgi:SOS-response transcriptional repressor LexA